MKRIIFCIIWMVVVAVGVVAYWVPSERDRADWIYEDKVVFETEQEYGAFKRAIANPDVSIQDVDVLSSEPPIVVDFSIRVPATSSFDYGDGHKHTGWAFAPIFVGMLLFLAPPVILLAYSEES